MLLKQSGRLFKVADKRNDLGSFEHPVDALRSEPRNKKARNLREVSKKTFSKQQIL